MHKSQGKSHKKEGHIRKQKVQRNMTTEGSENSIIFNRGERKGHRVYKYMHIYLWSTLCFETKIARICLATKRHKRHKSKLAKEDKDWHGFVWPRKGTKSIDLFTTLSF